MNEENILMIKNPENSKEFEQFIEILSQALGIGVDEIGIVDDRRQISVIPTKEALSIIPESYDYPITTEHDIQKSEVSAESNKLSEIQKNPLFIGFGTIDVKTGEIQIHRQNTTINDSRQLHVTNKRQISLYRIGKVLGNNATEIGQIRIDGINYNSPGGIAGRNIKTGHYAPNTQVGDNSMVAFGDIYITNIYSDSNSNYKRFLELKNRSYTGQMQEVRPYNLNSAIIGILGALAAGAIIYIIVSNYSSLIK
ncbi:MAG: hypothetical protein N3D75_02560 [Candidatus Aenigmarchaeota archaeon]|nr:hypothetical protein [Candidatus Aenigmarchaeota archaeon]